MRSDIDKAALEEALAECLGPLTLWELKQRVDVMVLKFGRDRPFELKMMVLPNGETSLVWEIDDEVELPS
jgi:hypothetical protein